MNDEHHPNIHPRVTSPTFQWIYKSYILKELKVVAHMKCVA